jgi:predicted dehydrogenase
MQLTDEQKRIGKENFQEAVGSVRNEKMDELDRQGFTRRSFIKGAAAAVPSLGAVYFGYEKLKGDPVRVGFIGTGDEGGILITQHPPAYMDIVAIADLRPSNRDRAFLGDRNENRVGLINKIGAEKASKIKRFDNHKALLAAKDDLGLQAVVIAVPLNMHAKLAIECMRAGLHVLSEKLMAHSIGECKEIIREQKQAGVLYAVGHQRHYSVLYDNANALVKQGLLGDIKFIRAQWHRNNSWPDRDSWRKPIPKQDAEALKGKTKEWGYESVEQMCHWRLYNETGGGLMAELGSHQLDAASIFLGKVRPIAVQGYGGKNFYGVQGVGSKDKQTDSREVDDHVYVTFEFPGPHHPRSGQYPDSETDENDIVVVTYSSINTNGLEPYGETIYGSRGTLMIHNEQEALLFKENQPGGKPGGLEQRLYVIRGKQGDVVMDTTESLAPATQAAIAGDTMQKISRGYTEEMEHFCHCVRTGNFKGPDEGGLRCNGVVAMADALMSLTSNLAMKYKKRIEFKDEWFDPDNNAVPETDPDIVGQIA